MQGNELLEALQHAQETSLFGFDISMIDISKRTPQENLRAFIVHLKTKTLKALAQELQATERIFRKAFEGQSVSFNQANQNTQKNLLNAAKNLHGFANKISNNLYSIQKVQPLKQVVHPSEAILVQSESKCKELSESIQKLQSEKNEMKAQIQTLENENIELIKLNNSFKLKEQILNENLSQVLSQEEQHHQQIQDFKQKIQQIMLLYSTQKRKWSDQCQDINVILETTLQSNKQLALELHELKHKLASEEIQNSEPQFCQQNQQSSAQFPSQKIEASPYELVQTINDTVHLEIDSLIDSIRDPSE